MFWQKMRARLAVMWSWILVLWLVTWLLLLQAWAAWDVPARRTALYNLEKPFNLSLPAKITSHDWVVLIFLYEGHYHYFQNWWAHYELLGAPMPVYVVAQVRFISSPSALARPSHALTTLAANRIWRWRKDFGRGRNQGCCWRMIPKLMLCCIGRLGMSDMVGSMPCSDTLPRWSAGRTAYSGIWRQAIM